MLKTTVSLAHTQRPEELNHILPLYHQKVNLSSFTLSCRLVINKERNTAPPPSPPCFCLPSISPQSVQSHHSFTPGTRASHTFRISHLGDFVPIDWSGFKWITIKELPAVSYAERNFGRGTTHAEYFSPGGLERERERERDRQRCLGFCSGSGCVSSR